MEKKVKRTFSKLREKILVTLSGEKKTINDIAKKSHINWRTVESHLVYLSGRGFVNEAFSSNYARIFEITPEGEEFVKRAKEDDEIAYHERKIMKAVKENNLLNFI